MLSKACMEQSIGFPLSRSKYDVRSSTFDVLMCFPRSKFPAAKENGESYFTQSLIIIIILEKIKNRD